ncbi:MAG: class I SAM-dependent methyltransferase [Candidatus Eisenbacteria bacterium]
MSDDNYSDFAARYDLFFAKFGERDPDVVKCFRSLFEQNAVRGILDCACGTGRDLPMFHRLGLEVFGSDIAPSMLAKAEENMAGLDLAIPLRRVDYRELPRSYQRRFDAVACLSTSLLEMPDEGEVLRALKSMREVLNERGILVMSQGTTDKQWSEKPRFIPAVNRQDFSRVFVIDYEGRGAHYNVLDLFHSDETCEFKVWTAHYHIVLLKDDLERLLKDAGFGLIEFYGSYRLEAYDKASSDVLLTVAHR